MPTQSRAQLLATVTILLVLSVWFITVSLKSHKAERGQPDSYFGRGNSLLTGSGIVTLLAYWVTGNTLMASPESTYDRGVIGSLGYALIGGVALIVFAPIARRVKLVVPQGATIGDFVTKRFGKMSHFLLITMQILYSLGVLATQGAAGEYALHDVLGLPNQVALALILIVTMSYTAIGGFGSVIRVGSIQVFIIFVVAVVVPIYIYLKYGMHAVYVGMMRYNPSSLHTSMPGNTVFLISGMIMGIGEVVMDNGFWQRAFAIRQKSVVSAFIWSGLMWMCVPLSISTLAFIALSRGVVPPNAAGIAPYVAESVGGWLIGSIMLLGVWAAVTSTVGGFLNSLVTILLYDVLKAVPYIHSVARRRSIGRYVTVLVGLVVYVAAMSNSLSLFNTLTLLGVINAALIGPIVFGVFGNRLRDAGASTAMLLSIGIGYYLYFSKSHYLGIVASLVVSIIVSTIGRGLNRPNSCGADGCIKGEEA